MGIAADLVARWTDEFPDLTDIQVQAVRAGLFTGSDNLLVAAPTSSGKTLVGEMAAAAGAHAGRRHAVFAVPFKALAAEHFLRLQARYEGLLRIVISDGDHSEFDEDIRRGNYALAVCTYEKLQFLVGQDPSLLDRLSVLVVDEVQLVGEPNRGPALELMLTHFLYSQTPPRIVALSASLDDLGQLAHWLRAAPVVSRERPVPLTECVADLTGTAFAIDGEAELREVKQFRSCSDREQLLDAVCSTLVGENQQVLVFHTQLRSTVDTSERLVRILPARGLSEEVGRELSLLEDPDARSALQRCLSSGVAYHNADLAADERRIVEAAFRDGTVRVLVATTTLAMGVNLPSDWTIVADTTRWSPQGRTDISVAEYKNMAGRAGRLGRRSAGYSLLLADSTEERRRLFADYVSADPENVRSQIPRQRFEDLVFSIVCSDAGNTEDQIVEFLTRTLAYETDWEPAGDGVANTRRGVSSAMTRCLSSNLVVQQDGRYVPTGPARQLAQTGLSLATAIRLMDALGMVSEVLPDADILLQIASCAECGDRPWPRRVYGHAIDPRPPIPWSSIPKAPGGPLDGLVSRVVLEDAEIAALVRLTCLFDWTAGVDTRTISRSYQGAAPVRLKSLGEAAAALIGAMLRAGTQQQLDETVKQRLHDLEQSCRYGVPPELAGLARLRVHGVGRDALTPLLASDKGRQLVEPDAVLEAAVEDFDGLLSPAQVVALQLAIEQDAEESMERRRVGQEARAQTAGLPTRLINDLYTRDGTGLEQPVCDAMNHIGLAASRLVHQPHGEEDIRLTHSSGTVVVSVTASETVAKPIKWTKANGVLGQGAGLNPVNYVCIGRPRFEALAIERASQIGQETGGRTILLLTMPAFAEMILRVVEGRMQPIEVADVLALRSGVYDVSDLPAEELAIGQGVDHPYGMGADMSQVPSRQESLGRAAEAPEDYGAR
jgi:helicase